MQIIPCSICVLCACFQGSNSHLYFGSISKMVVEFFADLMILFLCSAKLVSCALKPNCADADIDKSTKIPSPPPHPLYLVSNLFIL